MFRMPLTKLAVNVQPPAPEAMPAPVMPSPVMPPSPMPPAPPPPMINPAPKSLTPSPTPVTPGATKAFKKANIRDLYKLALAPMNLPPRPRTGLINAVTDTAKDYLDGAGQYSLDVLNENNKRTQRPNDPRVMSRIGGPAL